MNVVINAPGWANHPYAPNSTPGELRQLVNMTGPLASGMAAALDAVQRSEVAEQADEKPIFTTEQRSQIVGLCLVAAQLMADAALDACNALEAHRPN